MLSRSNKRGSYWYQANKCGRHPSPTVTNSILPLQQTNREKKDDAAYSHDSPIIILENKTTVDENWPECNELGGDGYSNERLKATSSAVLRPIVTVPRLPLKNVTTPTAHPPSSMSCSSDTQTPTPPSPPSSWIAFDHQQIHPTFAGLLDALCLKSLVSIAYGIVVSSVMRWSQLAWQRRTSPLSYSQ